MANISSHGLASENRADPAADDASVVPPSGAVNLGASQFGAAAGGGAITPEWPERETVAREAFEHGQADQATDARVGRALAVEHLAPSAEVVP